MKKLLIVVDMLNDFCSVGGVLSRKPDVVVGIDGLGPIVEPGEYSASSIIGDVAFLVNEYRAGKEPIIWLCDGHAKDDKEFDRFPPHAILNTWGAEIIDLLSPEIISQSGRELMIRKTRYSGFYGTDLEYQLARLAPEQTEVAGLCTSICVMDTVGGLANRDYNVVVYEDCVADFNPELHRIALERMEALYGAKVMW